MRKTLILAIAAGSLALVGLGTAGAQGPGGPPARRSILSRLFPRTTAALRGSEGPSSPAAEPPVDDDPRKSKEWSTGRNLPSSKPWMQGPTAR